MDESKPPDGVRFATFVQHFEVKSRLNDKVLEKSRKIAV